MSYAVPADMLRRYDAVRLGQLVRDDGTTASTTELLTDGNLQAALDDFRAEIDSAVLYGHRYLIEDLEELILHPQKGAKLIRLNCDGAYGYLVRRRGFTAQETGTLAPAFVEALNVLEQLRWGERVFNIEENLDAGSKVTVVPPSSYTHRPISSNVRIFGITGPDSGNSAN